VEKVDSAIFDLAGQRCGRKRRQGDINHCSAVEGATSLRSIAGAGVGCGRG
jgi:hypothetical protein